MQHLKTRTISIDFEKNTIVTRGIVATSWLGVVNQRATIARRSIQGPVTTLYDTGEGMSSVIVGIVGKTAIAGETMDKLEVGTVGVNPKDHSYSCCASASSRSIQHSIAPLNEGSDVRLTINSFLPITAQKPIEYLKTGAIWLQTVDNPCTRLYTSTYGCAVKQTVSA